MHGLRGPCGNPSGFQETTLPCLGKCYHRVLWRKTIQLFSPPPPLIAHPFKSLIDKWNTASKTLLPTLGAAWAHQVQPPNLVVGLPKWQCTLANLVNLIFDWWIFLGCWHAVASWLAGISFWIQPKHGVPTMHAIGAWWCLARQGQLSSGFATGGVPRCMQPPV